MSGADKHPEAFRTISWRTGTKGPLKAEFAALRVRVADGPVAARGRHLPGEEVWLVGEHRASGERKYYLTNPSADEVDVAVKRHAAAESRRIARELRVLAVRIVKEPPALAEGVAATPCDPPYRFTNDGRKIYRVECF